MKNNAYAKILAEKEKFLDKLGKEPWVVVGQNEPPYEGTTFWSCLIQKESVEDSLADLEFDSEIGTQSYHLANGFFDNSPSEYVGDSGRGSHYAENLVHFRSFQNVIAPYFEVCEEFRLLNNLFTPQNDTSLFTLLDDGEKEEVVRFTDTSVSIHLKYLKKYISVKQMCLVLLQVTQLEFSNDKDSELTPDIEEAHTSSTYSYEIFTRRDSFSDYNCYIFSGKKILLPNPVEECGYCPYEKEKIIVTILLV